MRTTAPQAMPTVPPGARLVPWIHGLFLVGYVIGVSVPLVAAVIVADDPGALLDPKLERLGDPKDAIPAFFTGGWNPVAWAFWACYLMALMVYPFAIAAVLLGIAALIQAWRTGDRRLVRRTAVSSVACLALLAFAWSPYGQQLLHWLLD